MKLQGTRFNPEKVTHPQQLISFEVNIFTPQIIVPALTPTNGRPANK